MENLNNLPVIFLRFNHRVNGNTIIQPLIPIHHLKSVHLKGYDGEYYVIQFVLIDNSTIDYKYKTREELNIAYPLILFKLNPYIHVWDFDIDKEILKQKKTNEQPTN